MIIQQRLEFKDRKKIKIKQEGRIKVKKKKLIIL